MKYLKLGILMIGLSAATVVAEESNKEMTTKLITHESSNTFDQTLEKLTKAVEAKGLKTFAIIDHAKGAASIGETLRPTTLVLFGNPKGGTPFMQSSQTMGLDLPLKALVYEDESGAVKIATTDIKNVSEQHQVKGLTPLQTKITGLLTGLAEEAGQ